MKRAINVSEAMMASLALTSDYETVDHEKIDKVASSVQNTCLEKIAGIYIDNPTQENIEDFIRKYMYNELTFFPRVLEVGVSFIPSSFDKVRKNLVEDGTGAVQVKVRSKIVELPFMIHGGDLEPFDVIQMDNQRVPYSRENLQKIIINLDRQLEKEQSGESDGSPYQGLADYTNPSTAPGFMGDVLSIRDSQSYTPGSGRYVTASSEFTELEKTASNYSEKNIQDLTTDQMISVLNKDGDLSFDTHSQLKSASETLDDLIKEAEFHEQCQAKNKAEKKSSTHEFYENLKKDLADGTDKTASENMLGEIEFIGNSNPTPAGLLEKSADEYDAMGLGWSSHRKDLADGFDKALQDVEREKSTVPAPMDGEDAVKTILRESGMKLDNGNIDKEASDHMKRFVEDGKNNFKAIFGNFTKKPHSNEGLEELGSLRNQFKKHAGETFVVTDLNAIMEKVASLKPMTEEEMNTIAFVLNKRAAMNTRDELEKLAADEEKQTPTRKDLDNAEKMVKFKFEDARHFDHGTFIVFPEIKDGKVSMTPGIVLSNLDTSFMSGKTAGFKFVCANDGRIKILEKDAFLCKKVDSAFKLVTTELRALQNNDNFFALNGDKVTIPLNIGFIGNLSYGNSIGENKISTVGYYYNCKPINSGYTNSLFSGKTVNSDSTDIYTLDEHKFEQVSHEDFLTAKAKESGLSEDIINSLMSYSGRTQKEVVVADPHSKVIKIAGIITTNFKDQNEFDTKNQLHDAGYDVEKVAFALNTVVVECVDRRVGIYNVFVDYKDTNQRFFNLRNQNFNRIKEGKVRAVLRILRFQGNKLNEIIYKAKNEPRASYPIPAECTAQDIQKLQGGAMTNVSTRAVKNIVQKYVNPLDIAKTLASTVMGAMITKSVVNMATPGGAVFKAGNILGKLANETAELSPKFEKYAQTHESEEYLDVARILGIGYNLSEKLATIIEDNNNLYPNIKEVVSDISLARPVLEKIAYDLTALKVNGTYHNIDTGVDKNDINRAVATIDNIYKIAKCLDESIDKDKLDFSKKSDKDKEEKEAGTDTMFGATTDAASKAVKNVNGAAGTLSTIPQPNVNNGGAM